MNKRHYLALADGEVFYGESRGAETNALGEAVFNTGMTGYQEIVSDPSYAGQFVALSTPEIGNYGCNPDDMESRGLFLNGLLTREMNPPSNFRSRESLDSLLKRHGKPALTHVDIRRLVLHLRDNGTQKAFLHAADDDFPPEKAVEIARQWEGLDGKDYASEVSTPVSYDWNESVPHTDQSMKRVVALDFGIKYNILRSLLRSGITTRVLPALSSAEQILSLKPDGVFLSNGPGDPSAVQGAIETVRQLLGRLPIMGICLGHQIIAIACGANCERLKFGHHGCNHPVRNLLDGSIAITSQNHNFAVVPDSLPNALEITHVNLNDGTIEGIRHREYPVFSVQYHPEASPGPLESSVIFERFKAMIDHGI